MPRGAFRWVVLGLAGALAGCGASVPARPVKLIVTPPGSLLDTPVRLDLSGLKPGQRATIRLRSVDAAGTAWSSTTTFAADAHGAVDTSHQAPVAGGYHGISTTGIVWSMQPGAGPSTASFAWPANRPVRFTATVLVGGHPVASRTLQRQFSTVRTSARRVSASFSGTLYSATVLGRQPAMLMVSDPPTPLLARLLATKGYSVLEVSGAGASATSSLSRAARWLARQPHVQARQLVALGLGGSSDAALRLAVQLPGVIHGVIAARPDGAAAAIGVERIRGPILVTCGETGASGPSCSTAAPILARLQRAHDRYQHLLYGYPGAGPALSDLVPNEPFARALDPAHYEADQLGRAQLWPHLLMFLSVAAAGGIQEGTAPSSEG